MIRVGDLARIIESHAPLHYAQRGDNCGLQLGDARLPVRGVLVTLDPSPEAVRRAASLRANLIVSHHPLFFDPLRRIDLATPTGEAAAEALAGGISLYSAHTNLDAAPHGLSFELARRVGLGDPRPFASPADGGWSKLVVFVPEPHVERVHRAMAAAGAGIIGHYDSCAFLSPGEGRFRPLPGARPSVGRTGRLEKVKEIRLEMLVEEGVGSAVVDALRRSHPYEEVAYDLYPLHSPRRGGLGRVGKVRKVRLPAFARSLAGKWRTEARIGGKPPAWIETVAVVPGSGGSLVSEAFREGAQVLVTGEARYHQLLEAEHLGLGVIELGHDVTELPAVDLLAGTIRRGLRARGDSVPVRVYKRPRTTRTVRG